LVKTLKKKDLEILLSKLKGIQKPRVKLEQYEITGELAAQIINIAYLSGDVKNKVIADFGCGSGKLAIGCALMGAKKVIGIDIDEEAIKIAEENLKKVEFLTKRKIQNKVKFFQEDILEWNGKVDVVIQNPPFGIQNRHADRKFIKKSLECAEKIYSLHRHYKKSRIFLKRFIEQNGGKIEKIIKFKFKIPHIFKFHKKPYVAYDVDLFIFSRLKNGIKTDQRR
jgi:putative methylase